VGKFNNYNNNNNHICKAPYGRKTSMTLKFNDTAFSVVSCLAVRFFLPKDSIVTKFCYLLLGDPVIMPHRVFRLACGACIGAFVTV